MRLRLVDLRLAGYVLELPITQVVIKNVLRPRQSARAAHHRDALPHARSPLSRRRRVRDVKVNVVCDHQVEQAVAVVIDKRAAGSPGFACARYPGLLRDFSEYSLLVVIEPVLAV